MKKQFVTATFISDIISLNDDTGKYEPIGKFYARDGKGYVACDNTTGDAWTEFFDSREEAIKWLDNKDPIYIGQTVINKITNKKMKVTRYDG
ncbi:hypothetical protein [Acholeplasma hippikon]|uniref:Uncharacterized protein n=1 Tax=Acholeplasma hippikon TaxID=264636 RepID=A0A449BL20_9MOLU|nr:hypothetical protein [Acholeplasma hippikon]VEU83139.1 Uncharacterised protein [Acholeplasma hippikon]VEU83350.1 Uncharacterised protein [Acholeplasma hippikon]